MRDLQESRVSLTKARESLGDLVSQVRFGNKPIVLTKNRTDIAVLVAVEDYAVLQDVLEKRQQEELVQRAKAALKEVQEDGTISFEELVEEVLQ